MTDDEILDAARRMASSSRNASAAASGFTDGDAVTMTAGHVS
jgi:hypothetical protein